MHKWLMGSFILLVSTMIFAAQQSDTINVEPTKQVVLETSKGDIVLELAPEAAPITVNNFLQYVDNGYYNGLVFHRVIKGFMIQGGGFGTEMDEKITRDPIKNESQLEARLSNRRGTIAMARTPVADSATSQFFINHRDNEFLDGKPNQHGYTVFGHVIKGMEVVDTIAEVETGYRMGHSDVPVEPVLIQKAYLVGAETAAN